MSRSVWIAVLVCAALGLTYFVTRRDQVKVGVRELSLPVFEAKAIDQIEIKSNQVVRLFKTGDNWQVEFDVGGQTKKGPANKQYVTSLLSAASGLTGSHFVTERRDKQTEFKVSDTDATHVRLYDNQRVSWELLVGTDAEGSGKYVRLPGADAIFVAKGKFWDLTRGYVDDWRDRKLLPLAEDQMTKIEIRQDAKPALVLTRSESKWQVKLDGHPLPTGFRLDEARAALLARALSSARALSFVDDSEAKKAAEERLNSPRFRWVAHDNRGAFYELEASEAVDKKKIWVRLKGGDQVYEISEYVLKQLTPSIDELRDLSLFDVAPEKIRRVVIHTPKSETVLEKNQNKWAVLVPKQLPKGFVVDDDAIAQQLERLASLRASGLALSIPANGGGTQKPNAWIDLEDQLGKSHRVSFGHALPRGIKESTGNEIYVKGSVDMMLYRIGAHEKKQLEGGLDLFNPSRSKSQGLDSLTPQMRRQIDEMLKKQRG